MTPPSDITLDSEMPQIGIDLTDFFRKTAISFVIADARLPDMPIIYVNRAFELTTGYSHRFVIGRNCRFLQGANTDPEAVRNIAIALSRREAVQQKLLNYRADGSSFINDLVITPIHDPDGEVAYFVGMQREVDNDDGTLDEIHHKTIDIVRQQVQIHLSVVMEMSRLHMGLEPEGDKSSEDVQTDFLNLMRRLETLDLLYENINESSLSQEQLDVGAYISQIAAKLVTRNPKAGVRINISTDKALVPLDVAVRLGVILAELLDASLESSFDGLDSGELEVSLTNHGDRIELVVYDDGMGDISGSEWITSGDLTLKVIKKLLKEVDATIEAPETDQGREIKVVVPVRQRG